MKKIFFSKISKNNGYTIIEMMISISLFLIIIMTGMGALLNANLLHQKSQDIRSIMDNLSFIMEDMSRNIRMGYNYYCIEGNDDLSSVDIPKNGLNCWGVAFEYATGDSVDTAVDGDPINHNDQWVYFIDNIGKIWKSTEGSYNNPPVNYIQLTPDEVVINVAVSGFSVSGAESGDSQQPFVTIKLAGKINFKGIETPFSLQTSVSQRVLDR